MLLPLLQNLRATPATGSGAATESGADAAALSGAVIVSAALAATESGPDASAIVGQVVVVTVGTLAAVELGNDRAFVNSWAEVFRANSYIASGATLQSPITTRVDLASAI